MKIVLLQDVKALGKKGTIVEVAEGYARNFLLPKKLGAPATAENLNTLKLKKANEERIAAEQLAEAKALAEKIGESSVTVSIKGGENGKTYGSVSTKEIAARTRFAAVKAAVADRAINLTTIGADQQAFEAQKNTAGGKKTFNAYLWKVCGQAYDAEHPRS